MSWPTEVVVIVGATIASILSGAGFFGKWALSQVDAIRAISREQVAAAEKREGEANARAKEERESQNKRIDLLTDGVNAQSKTIVDLSTALKAMGDGVKAMGDGNREDLKKVNDGITTLLARSDHRAGRT